MQQGDYSSSYYNQYHPPPPPLQNPNPNRNPNDLHQPSPTTPYASAPPYISSEYPNSYSSSSSSNYPPYPQNPDPLPSIPPTAPSYTPPPPNPNYQSFNNPPPSPLPLSSYPTVSEQQAPPQYQSAYYSPYDQHQTGPNYMPPPPSPPPPSQVQFSSVLNPNSSSYPYTRSTSMGPGYDMSYETSLNRGGSYLDERPGSYGGGGQNVFGRSRSDLGSDYYDKRPENNGHRYDDGIGQQEVYAYQGGKVEPYGARGTGSKSSTWDAPAFDDYGRSISLPSGKGQVGGSTKVVKAVPKMETQQDVKNGVQKFRVKLLAESGGQSTMDVLCQIGLDGIHMLDPNTSRMLRIYPLETVTRSEVTDSSIFTFWSKSSVDFEPRRIRLQSNSYTTNTILDIVTAATFQLKEMGKDSFRSKPSDPGKVSEQLNEKKKGFDWVNLIKPGNEEKDHWVPDEAITKCTACGTDFGAFVRKHHCRNCGDIFCDKCTHGRIALTADENAQPVRVCDRCMAEVTRRLSSAKESASKPASLRSHEDLAKKLQEEMERNRKASSGTKSYDGSSKRMKDVACPTCTVHLQVQVPTSGSETIECGVCQHPFLVSAN